MAINGQNTITAHLDGSRQIHKIREKHLLGHTDAFGAIQKFSFEIIQTPIDAELFGFLRFSGRSETGDSAQQRVVDVVTTRQVRGDVWLIVRQPTTDCS